VILSPQSGPCRGLIHDDKITVGIFANPVESAGQMERAEMARL
jgi:hypothetical protein